jgi:hypothetical protein
MWKKINNYENYEISTDGEVRSLDREVKTQRGSRHYKGKLLKPNIGTNGYYYVQLSKNGISETKYIHKLVTETYLTNPDNLSDVDHINENKLDNRVENLQYLNHFDNASKSNKGKNRYDKHLENNPKAKVVVGVKDGEIVEHIDCAKKLVDKYNIKYSTLKYKLQNNNCKIGGINYYYDNNFN